MGFCQTIAKPVTFFSLPTLHFAEDADNSLILCRAGRVAWRQRNLHGQWPN
jgi:hypothetical protein